MSGPHSPADAEAVDAPTVCPFCRSQSLATAAGKQRASNYWRCDSCGQVWNPERLRLANRYDSPRRRL